MPIERIVAISVERYDQLIRAEQDANQLKALISDSFENYEVIDRAKLALLNKLYFGNKEDNDV